MSACARCGAALRSHARFCGACGAAADDDCAGCGAPLRPGARFCGACGAPTAADGGTVVAPAPATAHGTGPFLYVLPAGAAPALVAAVPGRVLQAAPGDALAAVQAALRADVGLEAVCLVGDDEALPFSRVEDPCGYDDAVLTDVFYGMRTTPTAAERMAGDVVPDVPVSRIPSDDPALVRRLLGATLYPSWSGGLGVSAAVWREATTEVLSRIGAGLEPHLSPPRARAEVEAHLRARPGRLLFNVHGTLQEPAWYGEGDGRFPEVLRPSGVEVAEGAVVFSEACYGATLADGAESIAPTFLERGAGCFVGSTVIAWGSSRGGPPLLADDLATHFYRALDEGRPGAVALHEARLALVEAAGGGLSAPLHNTAISFVYYGAPQQAGALARARAQLRARLTPGAWQVLSTGRVAMRALSGEVRDADAVARRLEQLLDARPADARVVRYGSGAASVLCEVGAGPVMRRAGVDVDATGRILRGFVSR